jgi:hypothetical protein
MKISLLLGPIGVVSGIVVGSLACTKQQASSIADVTIKIAGEICQEEAQQPSEPAWVALACQVEGVAGTVAHVLLPRSQWLAMKNTKAPSAEAGPGK